MKVNLHTHTTYCDGKNSVEEMIQDAIASGFRVLGFSGHSYTSFDESYCMSREQTAAYCAEVEQLAEKYKEKIKVFCGIEQDIFGDDSAEDFAYAIGSVHAIFKEWPGGETEATAGDAADTKAGETETTAGAEKILADIPGGIIATDRGCYIYEDWDAEAMAWAIKHLYGGDSLALAEDYFHTVAQVADMPGVQIVGHFDLLTKFEEKLAAEGKQPLFDTEHPRYRKAAEDAIEKLVAAGKIFEINTGAMAKGLRTTPYPSLPLLKRIREAGGRITVNSDCHAAGKLDWGFEEALALAREAGFDRITVLAADTAGKPVWMEVDL